MGSDISVSITTQSPVVAWQESSPEPIAEDPQPQKDINMLPIIAPMQLNEIAMDPEKATRIVHVPSDYPSINEAVAACASGPNTKIIVHTGSYEGFVLPLLENRMTIEAADGEYVEIKHPSGNSTIWVQDGLPGSSLSIKNFSDIQACSAVRNVSSVYLINNIMNGCSFDVHDARFFIAYENKTYYNPIQVYDTVDYSIISNNHLDSYPDGSYTALVFNSKGIISNNILSGKQHVESDAVIVYGNEFSHSAHPSQTTTVLSVSGNPYLRKNYFMGGIDIIGGRPNFGDKKTKGKNTFVFDGPRPIQAGFFANYSADKVQAVGNMWEDETYLEMESCPDPFACDITKILDQHDNPASGVIDYSDPLPILE